MKPGLKQPSEMVLLPRKTASTTSRERAACTTTSFMVENVRLGTVHLHTRMLPVIINRVVLVAHVVPPR